MHRADRTCALTVMTDDARWQLTVITESQIDSESEPHGADEDGASSMKQRHLFAVLNDNQDCFRI